MKISNCKRCKKVFSYKKSNTTTGQEYCPKCMTLIIEEVNLLYSHIEDNREITLSELSKKANISERVIKTYIAKGKLPCINGYKLKLRKI